MMPRDAESHEYERRPLPRVFGVAQQEQFDPGADRSHDEEHEERAPQGLDGDGFWVARYVRTVHPH
jgi:hypothetical protein